MASKLLEKKAEPITKGQGLQTCIHHWIIEPPEGPVSNGICKKCGTESQFRNYLPHSIWEGEKDKNGKFEDESGFTGW